MARMTKAAKLIETQVEAAFTKYGERVQFDMMDLGKIMNAGRDAIRAGESVDEAMIAAVARYRKN